ncbi:MAG: hypothetical protein KDA93_07450 [Planctomycetaceae bacterium]|nr:hypothetical protein [Planctomycetaceae bacterium]
MHSFQTLDRSLKLATGRIDELLAELEAKKSEATFVFPMLNESIELYAQQESPDKAREQINALVQEMTLNGNGELAKQFQSFLLSSLAYCLGDREEYLSLNEDVEEPGFDLHFTRGDLHEAVGTISADDTTSDQIDRHLAVYLKAHQVGEEALAEQQLSRAIELLRESSREEKLYAEALSPEGTSDPDLLLGLTVLPNNKRVILAALGVRHAADQNAYWALARRLNYERKFPWLFLNELLSGE